MNCEYRAKSLVDFLCLLRSDWNLRWLDFCICTDASEKGFAFAVREGCRELASEVGRVSERTRLKRSSKSIRAKSGALRSIAREAGLECSSSDEDVLSLGRVARTSQNCRCNFRIPRNGDWRRTVVSPFRGSIMVLEAHAILHAVRHARVIIRRDAP